MNIFIINLPSAIERRKFQEAQLSKLGLDYEVLNATSTNDINKTTYEKHYYDWERPLRDVEVACYYSHRSTWQRVIDDNQPALILEDDALLARHISELLDVLDKLTNADLVQLEVRSRKKLVAKKSIKITSKFKLHRLYQDRTGAAGYVLWPSGARKLLKYEKNHGIGLADAHIATCYNLTGYQIEPAVIIQLDQCENYQIKPPINTDSHILSQPKPIYKNKIFYKTRRIFSQLKMALRQLRFSLQADRRLILLNKKDFHAS
jgi:glycosyl transferase family 25